MDVGSSPLSALTVLVLCMPGVFLAGRAVARWLGGAVDVRSVVAPGLSVAMWLLAVHIIGLVTHSFRRAFIAGTVGVAAFGVGSWIVQRRSRGVYFASAKPRIPRSYWVGALAATGLMAPMFITWCMHDEVIFVGHLSIPSQILNDIYPPRYTSMPAVLLRYHYGFDLLVACAAILTRLRMDRAIDFVTIACFFQSYLLFCVLGKRVLGRNGNLCAFLAIFGAGLPMATPGAPLNVGTMLGICQIEGLWLNPPFVSYFMQHPWTLGLPMALTATLVAMDSKSPKRRRMLLLVMLLVMLSLSQVVLFLTLSGALFMREVFQGPRRLVIQRAFVMALLLGVTGVLAYRMGGFFTPLPGMKGFGIVFRPGIVPTFVGNIQWIALTFGFLLPLGLAGFWFVRAERIFLGTLLTGSTVVILLFHYEKTWDILKFAVITALVLGILSSATIARIAAIRPRFLSVPLVVLLMGAATVAGIAHPLIFGANVPGIPAHWYKDAPLLAHEDMDAVKWLRARIRVGEIVYRNESASAGYAIWGGIPQGWIHNERSFGADPAAVYARDRLMQTRPPDRAAWAKQGFRYFVVAPADAWLRRLTSTWEKNGEARSVARFGSLEIIEIRK